jgi:hypothetical protein
VGVHPQAQSRRPHDHSHDALSRGSRSAVRPHRDAEGRPRRGARHDPQSSVALRGPHRASRRARGAGGLARARPAPRGRRVVHRAFELRPARAAARRPAPGGHPHRGARARRDRPRAGVPQDHVRSRRAGDRGAREVPEA